jgi:hypothetical protein
MKFAIYYYDVLKEVLEFPTSEDAIRYMGHRYGGTAGMRVIKI